MFPTLAKLYLWLLLAARINGGQVNGSSVSENAVCVPKLDYDLNMLQKITNLESKFENLERKINESNGMNTVTKGCPNGWLIYEGSCYLFGSDAVIFTVAEGYCRQRGSHLVHVESYEENAFLKGYMADQLKGTHYWIGITDEITEGVWRWHGSDKRVEFFDWGPSEPNGSAEDCAAFNINIGYKWADFSCTYQFKAVCEQ